MARKCATCNGTGIDGFDGTKCSSCHGTKIDLARSAADEVDRPGLSEAERMYDARIILAKLRVDRCRRTT